MKSHNLNILPATGTKDDNAPALVDGVGRRIDHLRLSVTPACDLRCHYCRPTGSAPIAAGHRALSLDQRVALVTWLVEDHGLRKVRITGGEPLLAPDVVPFIEQLKRRHPDLALAMTTNATRLGRLAADLRVAGLDRINISLDTIDPARFSDLTGGELRVVLDGIDAARQVGFTQFKINTVALAGVNDKEFADLIAWALTNGDEIRFLEVMPIGPQRHYNRKRFLSGAQMRKIVASEFTMVPLPRDFGLTSRRYSVRGRGVEGIIGFITPVTEPFCGDCRRLRLTADGMLYPCLLDSRSYDLSHALSDCTIDRTRADSILFSAVGHKKPKGTIQVAPMITIGG